MGKGSGGSEARRPRGTVILVVFSVLVGIIGLSSGVAVVGVYLTRELPGLGPGGAGLGVLAIVFGFLSVLLARGFWEGAGWAWLLGLGVFTFSLAVAVARLALGGRELGGYLQFALALAVIIYLTRPWVRAYFGKA
jgi:hypothetical protein